MEDLLKLIMKQDGKETNNKEDIENFLKTLSSKNLSRVLIKKLLADLLILCYLNCDIN